MPRLIASLAEIAADYDAVFCDLWGCLHNGYTPFPGAVAALQAFRAQGGRVVLMTNAPRPRGAVAAQLDRMGVPRDAWDLIVTSGDATQLALFSGDYGTRVGFIGAEKDESFFTDLPADLWAAKIERVAIPEAEVLLCTGLAQDLTETPEDYRLHLAQARNVGLTMLCANPDIIVDYGDKRLWCAGALAQAYEKLGGEALYFGKPHPPIYDLARRQLGLDDPRILCIGDGLWTDVKGGFQEGLDTLYVTGGISAHEFGPVDAPDPARLEAFLSREALPATYAIPTLQ
ncbi:TIGR01459 family HAD-type hydrolase [Stagnihabitans tardus]|uniref:TIGR01459 family HAD-type hydrolase n=1 Tax=Stagnihabitans tardus TaxID=2699202 RepID=A0AAE4YAX1_9RHOB|nr:TIGR01459 family HAD-type hydrolase [Stagnihabitans tardus]NBZ88322.1 TIGR01459 family HAD-type hydrolase [Stagnihabitans tardus]